MAGSVSEDFRYNMTPAMSAGDSTTAQGESPVTSGGNDARVCAGLGNSAFASLTGPGGRPNRLMTYAALFHLSAPNVEDAMTRFTRMVEDRGGYLESRENATVVCRIPATHFHGLVDAMPSFGTILHQSINSRDVTRRHRDLGLRIETAQWSRNRVMALLQRAEKLEDILKLEEELRKLIEQIESLQGELKDLTEQIVYSRVEVVFEPRTLQGGTMRPAAKSPFAWINRVGVDRVRSAFASGEFTAEDRLLSVPPTVTGGVSMKIPDGFIMVDRDRDQIKAISPDESKLYLRRFEVTKRADLAFWSEALKNNLVERRGYVLVEERPVTDPKGHDGRELLFEVVSQGETHHYLIALYVSDGPFWSSKGSVRVVQFAASLPAFANHVEVVRDATTQAAQLGGSRLPSGT